MHLPQPVADEGADPRSGSGVRRLAESLVGLTLAQTYVVTERLTHGGMGELFAG